MEGSLKMTVILPVYNREKAIKKSIESVLNQSFSNFEFIIIDDCSTDKSWEVINSYTDSRIKCFKLPVNSGAAAARNFGISHSEGNYISFLDSDDTFERDFLKFSFRTLHNSPAKVGFMWTGRNIITKNTCIAQAWNPVGNSSYHIFLRDIRIGTGAGITVKKEVFEICGKFNEELPAAEDTEFFFRISRYFDFRYINTCLINIYRDENDRMSKNYIKIARAYNVFLKDHFDEIEKDPYLRRLYYYKMMWLNFYIPDHSIAKYYFNKIPRMNIWDNVKIPFVFVIYKFLPLRLASYLHGKLAS